MVGTREREEWVEMVAGKGEVETVAGNHKGEIKMDEARTCHKCGRIYHCPSATSRIDNTEICPVCGAMEALETSPSRTGRKREDQKANCRSGEKSGDG